MFDEDFTQLFDPNRPCPYCNSNLWYKCSLIRNLGRLTTLSFELVCNHCGQKVIIENDGLAFLSREMLLSEAYANLKAQVEYALRTVPKKYGDW